MADCDRCVHLASAVGVQLVVAHPLETLRRIVHGADVVISAAARHGSSDRRSCRPPRSTGRARTDRCGEDSDQVLGSALKSRWSYAIAKSCGEAIASGYHREHGADATVARLFNTIGPRQVGAHGMVVPACPPGDRRRRPDRLRRRQPDEVLPARGRRGQRDRGPDRARPQRPGAHSTSAARSRSRSSDSPRGSSSAWARVRASRSCPTTRPMTMASRSWDSARPTSRLSRISPVGDREARSIKRSTT